MKEHSAIKQLNEVTKIELWAFTGVISLSLIFSFSYAPHIENLIPHFFTGMGPWVNLFFSYIITCILYFSLVLFVERIHVHDNQRGSGAVYFIYFMIGLFLLLGMVNVYFAILMAMRIFVIYFRSAKERKELGYDGEATRLFAGWLLLYAIALLTDMPALARSYLMLVAPMAILMYLQLLYVVMPRVMMKKNRRWSLFGTSLLYTLISSMLLGIVFLLLSTKHNMDEEMVAFTMLLNLATALVVLPILTWEIYKTRNRKRNEEIKVLQTELGKSDASLNFLKSQINPHFLFNALNTLYGTALQERAERTGEGIQMLGDMMRFMLQENIEDKILLSRDIEYLNNYIALQKLRTSVSPDISIETQIEQDGQGLQIAPMILIPFVENAFKHGISLNNPSHIKITLQLTENKLYFDVHNSLHLKLENDPERLQSGIGLQNVKQRLALLYPEKHELIIRQNAKEFFIHLILQLEGNQ
ncbi:putative two-component system sensor histidine kinase [Pedobacter sp. BAL39]|uniref:sensor histidine kinase n=1 Tax=Pedobacter sp. BAL39 TaxID=391596 RepID=UPI0001559B2C|nr:histidine kinase [Pedobacter sp. BAL39]EDM35475.1 putative two-component system sensor histidine kinase [Pedobacter sp. BAL39]